MDTYDLEYLLAKRGQVLQIGEEKGRHVQNGISSFVSPFGSWRFVMSENGKIIGSAQFVSLDGKKGTSANTYIAKGHRRRGIATALLDAAREVFEEVDFSEDRSAAGEGWVQSVSKKTRPLVAAIYVQETGVYQMPGVDAWGEKRDARLYKGPLPVVAHPPCGRWGRYWYGASSVPDKRFLLGDDGGTFAHAIWAVRHFGGILEHPRDSYAWEWWGLDKPPAKGGWVPADNLGGFTAQVDQGSYGHVAPKTTWLYAHSVALPELIWGPSGASGRVEKMSKKQRAATPLPFRDMLLDVAATAKTEKFWTQKARQAAKKRRKNPRDVLVGAFSGRPYELR